MNDHQPKISNRALTARLLIFAVGMFAFGFFVLPPMYAIYTIIAAMVISLASAIYPAIAASSVSSAESIHYE